MHKEKKLVKMLLDMSSVYYGSVLKKEINDINLDSFLIYNVELLKKDVL